MAAERYNLIVLGGGPGGYTAALTAARHKARVALVEAQAIGGTCLHWGCIPVKSLLHSAPTLDSPTPGGDWGTHWKASQKRMREQVSALMQGLTKTLKQAGVALVEGKGYVASPNSVRVGGALLETDAIILATGSKPATIPAAGLGDESSSLENWVVGNSNDFLSLDDLPKSLLIVGAGAIGCEFADLMKRYGVEVCLAEMLPQILPHFDMQIAQTLSRSFKKRGIEVRTGTGLNGITPDRSGVLATFQDGSSFSTDRVLVAVGRKPRIEDEVIAGVNIEISDGAVVVNEHFQTSVPNLFAVGDMIGGAYLLAHAAEAQGEHAALTALGMTTSGKSRSTMLIPACVYTEPEVATVGLSRDQAKAKGLECVEGKAYYLANGRAVATEQAEGVAKVVAQSKTGQVIGVHICGAFATELIAAATLAMNLNGTVADMAGTVWAHPTCSEVLKQAALSCLDQLK